MKIAAVVPAYNEGKNIYSVVKKIKMDCPDIDVIVVNDGSTDNTYMEAEKSGACVLNLVQNLGIGGAVQTGYIYAEREGYDAVIQVDGDGQHNPDDICRIVDYIKNDEADMVIGSRFSEKTDYKPSKMRKLGISFFSFLVSILSGEKFYDTTSGFRAVNKKVIRLFAEYYPKDYPEVETILYAHKRGIRIKEVSVKMNQRKGGRSSITPVKAVYYMVKVTCALLLQPSLKKR